MKLYLGWMLAACLLAATPAFAQGVSAEPGRSFVDDGWRGVDIGLALDGPAAFKTSFLNDPPRFVLDLPGVEWGALSPDSLVSNRVTGVKLGQNMLRPGWSRAVFTLDRPYALRRAGWDAEARALMFRLEPVAAETFAAIARPELSAAMPTLTTRLRQTGDRPLVVVLDPGHGGIDPGAESGGRTEASLMLTFARELRGMLESQGMTVVLTRETDVFVPLEARVAIAHGAGPDIFISLHADALAEGTATGATVYTLAATASDRASAALAERHDRQDMITGVDLTGQDDEIGNVLMDLARVETMPRSQRLAGLLVAAIGRDAGPLYKTPLREAGFSVLKSPEVPSVLVELGYLSNLRDFSRITDPVWRGSMAKAIAGALLQWQAEDAAEARLLRR